MTATLTFETFCISGSRGSQSEQASGERENCAGKIGGGDSDAAESCRGGGGEEGGGGGKEKERRAGGSKEEGGGRGKEAEREGGSGEEEGGGGEAETAGGGREGACYGGDSCACAGMCVWYKCVVCVWCVCVVCACGLFGLMFVCTCLHSRRWPCCSVLQCVAVCCSVLLCVAVSCNAHDLLYDITFCVCVCLHSRRCCVLQCVAVCCSVLQCPAVHMIFCMTSRCVCVCVCTLAENHDTGWRKPIGCLILIGHLLPKSPVISGSSAEKDLQAKVFNERPEDTLSF